MRARRDTRGEILDRAQALFHERGFLGFSYQDIAEPLGIKNAAIHYHFASKTDLGIALIRRVRDNLALRVAQLEREGFDPLRALHGYFDYYRLYLCREHQAVCAIGIMAAELASVPEAMREEAQKLIEEVLAFLERTLAEGRTRGQFQFEGEPADRALTLICAVGGGLQFARIMKDENLLDRVIARICAELGCSL